MANPNKKDSCERMRDFAKRYDVHTVAAAIRQDGEWQNCSQSSEESGLPIEARRFPIASVTKTFTAEQLLKTLATEKITVESPVRHILPDFTMQQPATAKGNRNISQNITIAEVLSHRFGIPPHTWAWVFTELNRQQFVQQRLPHLAPVGLWHESYRYSNVGYMLAGVLGEKVANASWEKQIQTSILDRLGMSNTGFLAPGWEKIPGMAHPFRAGESIPAFHAQKNHPIAPASEMFSTLTDLQRWADYLLQGEPDQAKWTHQVAINSFRSYGFGWRIEQLEGRKHVWHTGSCSGYSSLISLLPESKQAVVLLCNSHGLTDELLNLAFASFASKARRKQARIKPLAPPPENTERYEHSGIYEHPGYGQIEITKGAIKLNQQAAGFLRSPTEWWMAPYRFGIQCHLDRKPARPVFSAKLESKLPPIKFVLKD